jgi:protein-L-isoaspartate(D-aspartate) O-methyltransferase
MSSKPKQFPLTLSSVVNQQTKKTVSASSGRSQGQQTASQNVSQRQSPLSPFVPGTSTVPDSVKRAALPITNVGFNAAPSPALASESIRHGMVERIAQQGVKDELVLSAMRAVQRHLFVESGMASQAYIDASLPIGHHQTISQPYIVARMIEVMRDDKPLQRVLEIGTGCGYQAAVLSLVAKDVYSIERIKALHELAKSNLRPMRIPNIRLQYGDGMVGLPQVAPFDGIILAAAGLEVPQALRDQLAIGGRLVAPVGGRHQVLELTVRISKHEWRTSVLENCHFVPLRPGVV